MKVRGSVSKNDIVLVVGVLFGRPDPKLDIGHERDMHTAYQHESEGCLSY